MAREMIHAVDVHADSRTLSDAISTSAGLQSFWTTESTAEPRVGSIAEFRFPGAPVSLKMRVDRLEPGQDIVWTCLGDFPHWPGTTVTWTLSALGNGHTRVLFRHAGFATDYADADFGSVNFTWGQVMARLKAFAESGTPQPYFDTAPSSSGSGKLR
jgi:uncharacterized protein YndB with AHSA1/START domain